MQGIPLSPIFLLCIARIRLVSGCSATELCDGRPSPHPELGILPGSPQACHDSQQTPAPSQQPPGPDAHRSACPAYHSDSAGHHVVPDWPSLVSTAVHHSGNLGVPESLVGLDGTN